MAERWIDFLESQGLSPGEDGYSHTGSEGVDAFQKLAGDSLCDLHHVSMIHVSGEDAQGFLQNQFTNDIAALDDDSSMLAGYCNAKGRLICTFRIRREADGFLLTLPATLAGAVLERLSKYVLRSRVTFDESPDLVRFGLCGKTAAQGLQQAIGELPRRDDALVRAGALTVTRVRGDGRPRYEVTGPVSACTASWRKLTRHATVVGSWSWARLDILAGIPVIRPPTSELFIPQMVNLDLVGGVNFKKGCYPGQEIVARMHYLGNLKQRMGRFRADADDPPQAGDRVYAPGGSSPAGTVVDAQPGAGAGCDLLAVVRIADFNETRLHLGGDRGPPLFPQTLPYRVLEADGD